MLAKQTEALKKRVRQHVGFHPTLKLTRPGGTGDKPRKAPVRLDSGSVRNLEQRYPYELPVPMQKRLQDGHECYALQNDTGEYESFIWIASGHGLYADELGTYIWVPEDVAYLYDGFTWPKVSGRGLFTELILGVVASSGLAGSTIKRFEAWVDRGNKSSRRAFEKAGFRVYSSYTTVKVGPARLFTGKPYIDKDLSTYTRDDDVASAVQQRCW